MTGKTPIYGIPYPDGTTKANKLGDELGVFALGVEAALDAASVPDVTNPDRAVASTDLARDAHFGKPSSEADRLALQRRGAECVRPDKGWTERYYATYNANTNPSGVAVPGWYPVSGLLPYGKTIAGSSGPAVASGAITLLSEGTTPGIFARGVGVGLDFNLAAGTWTVRQAGRYLIAAGCGYATNAAGGRQVRVERTTPAGVATLVVWNAVNGNSFVQSSRVVDLQAGDVLRAYAFHDAGTALGLRVGDGVTFCDFAYQTPPVGALS